MSLLHVGAGAPDFTARTDTGEEFRLGALRGVRPVVLFFYPKDFTLGCTAEACAFRGAYPEILLAGAALLGISRDDDEAHERFRRKHRLPFPLVSDSDGRIAKLYGVQRSNRLLAPMRVTYVVEASGMITRVIHHELLVWKHADEALEEVRELRREAFQAGGRVRIR